MPPLRSPHLSILPRLHNPSALHFRGRAPDESVSLTLCVFAENRGGVALENRDADVVGYVPMRHDLIECPAPVGDLRLDEEDPSPASCNEVGTLSHVGNFVPHAMPGSPKERSQVVHEDMLCNSGSHVVSSNSFKRRTARIEE